MDDDSLLTDDVLMEQAAAGSSQAFELLVARHYRTIRACACAMLRDEATADDIAQTVLVRLLRAIDQRTRLNDLRAWLLTVTINACRDERRRASRAGHFESLDVATRSRHPAMAHQPHHALGEQHERARALYHAISALPRELAEVVCLRYFAGATFAQSASILRIPMGTVSTRLRRALVLLGKSLRDHATAEAP
jgi:RNA polymerase sigma-70 factor, ECF subfamily